MTVPQVFDGDGMASEAVPVAPVITTAVGADDSLLNSLWDDAERGNAYPFYVGRNKLDKASLGNVAILPVILTLTFVLVVCTFEISRNSLEAKELWNRRLSSRLRFCGNDGRSRRGVEGAGNDRTETPSRHQVQSKSFPKKEGSGHSLGSGGTEGASVYPGGARPKERLPTRVEQRERQGAGTKHHPRPATTLTTTEGRSGSCGDQTSDEFLIKTRMRVYRLTKPIEQTVAIGAGDRQAQIKRAIQLAVNSALRVAFPMDLIQNHALAKLRCIRRLLNFSLDMLAGMGSEDFERVMGDRDFVQSTLKCLNSMEVKVLAWETTLALYTECVLPRLQVARTRIHALRSELLLKSRPVRRASNDNFLTKTINAISLTCLYGNVYVEEEIIYSRLEWQIFTRPKLSPAAQKYLIRHWKGSQLSFLKYQIPRYISSILQEVYDLILYMTRRGLKHMTTRFLDSVLSFVQQEVRYGSVYNSELASPCFGAGAIIGIARLDLFARREGLHCLQRTEALFKEVINPNFGVVLTDQQLERFIRASRITIQNIQKAFNEIRRLLKDDFPSNYVSNAIELIRDISTSHNIFLEVTTSEVIPLKNSRGMEAEVSAEWTSLKRRWIHSQKRALYALRKELASWGNVSRRRNIEATLGIETELETLFDHLRLEDLEESVDVGLQEGFRGRPHDLLLPDPVWAPLHPPVVPQHAREDAILSKRMVQSEESLRPSDAGFAVNVSDSSKLQKWRFRPLRLPTGRIPASWKSERIGLHQEAITRQIAELTALEKEGKTPLSNLEDMRSWLRSELERLLMPLDLDSEWETTDSGLPPEGYEGDLMSAARATESRHSVMETPLKPGPVATSLLSANFAELFLPHPVSTQAQHVASPLSRYQSMGSNAGVHRSENIWSGMNWEPGERTAHGVTHSELSYVANVPTEQRLSQTPLYLSQQSSDFRGKGHYESPLRLFGSESLSPHPRPLLLEQYGSGSGPLGQDDMFLEPGTHGNQLVFPQPPFQQQEHVQRSYLMWKPLGDPCSKDNDCPPESD